MAAFTLAVIQVCRCIKRSDTIHVAANTAIKKHVMKRAHKFRINCTTCSHTKCQNITWLDIADACKIRQQLLTRSSASAKSTACPSCL